MGAHVVLAWEMGSELGHLANFSALAQGLLARGHRVTLVLKDLSRAERFVAGMPVTLLQGPGVPRQMGSAGQVRSLAAILSRHSFQSFDTLWSCAYSWRTLFTLLQPDLVVLDYAPTAQLAMRGLGIPTLLTGFAFGAPPCDAPLRDLSPWLGEQDVAKSHAEQEQVLSLANQWLQAQGEPPLGGLSELFAADRLALTQLPELDPDARLRGEEYVGPLQPAQEGRRVTWLTPARRRVLCYLKPGVPLTPLLLAELARQQCEVECFYPAPLPEAWQAWLTPTFRIHAQLLDLPQAMAGADLVVCHGGIGTVSSALLAACPMLLVPLHTEQRGNAEQVVALGAGLYLSSESDEGAITHALDRLWQEANFAYAAREIAQRHAGGLGGVSRLLECCDMLLGETPS